MKETITLYRPLGQKELDLIKGSDYTKFPPRLPEQPITIYNYGKYWIGLRKDNSINGARKEG